MSCAIGLQTSQAICTPFDCTFELRESSAKFFPKCFFTCVPLGPAAACFQKRMG